MAFEWTPDEVRAAMSTCTPQIDETGDQYPYCTTHQTFMDLEENCPVVLDILDALEPAAAKGPSGVSAQVVEVSKG
ncbi:hypothetical protein ACI3EY_08085 [Ornithinimicrobium sp. LYQ92]|uniref:hypothetical protein n=1 Tax=Serinicoccus sp. LYQ92 TaxID=3378798 RepID=UPI0038518F0D